MQNITVLQEEHSIGTSVHAQMLFTSSYSLYNTIVTRESCNYDNTKSTEMGDVGGLT